METAGADGFAVLYREVYPKLVGVLRLAVPARAAEAEDVAQEALARTCANWARVQRGSNPAGYAYRVAFRLAFRRRRTPRPDLPESTLNPDTGVLDRIVILAALERLPHRQRQCVVLTHYADMDSEQIGRIIGIRASTVRVHLGRAREALAEMLEPTERPADRAADQTSPMP
jgi:RNA polymerase sigma factor (sigma-70 family)